MHTGRIRMCIHTSWLTASLAGLWSSTGLLGSNAMLSLQIGDSGHSELMIGLTSTIIFVLIPLQVAVIGRQAGYAESLAFGNPSEQSRYCALVGRCLLWLISAIASGCLLGSVTQAFVMSLLA